MHRVEGGYFVMGATPEQADPEIISDKPAHIVSLSSFYMAETEVTNALWQAVMPEWHVVEERVVEQQPVSYVSYADCQEFIRRLNAATGMTFRLPTEAEWEYAARGGMHAEQFRFAGSNHPEEVGWLYLNSGNKKRTVARLRPNALGLYDMTGNLAEWCADWFAPYQIGNCSNPQGPSTGDYRVARGGSYDDCVANSHLSVRTFYKPDVQLEYLGFRLALTLDNDPANQRLTDDVELVRKVRIGGRRIRFVYVPAAHPFYVAQTPISNGQWAHVMGEATEGRASSILIGMSKSAREQFVELCRRATKESIAAATKEELTQAAELQLIDTLAIPPRKLKRWQRSDVSIQRHRQRLKALQKYANLINYEIAIPDDPILSQYTDDPIVDAPLWLIIRL